MLTFLGLTIPVIYLHLGTLALGAVLILAADKLAFSWVRGAKETLPARTLSILHCAVAVVLVVMILSGIFLMQPLRDFLVQSPAFWIKMGFVLVLVVNSFFIGALMKTATTQSFASLPSRTKRLLIASGGASALGWIGAFIAALFMPTSGWVAYFITQFLALFS